MSDSQTKAQLKQARKLIDSGEYEKAKDELEQYLQLHPDVYQALVLKGFACHALHDKVAAAECFERAIQLEPNNTLAWRGILETYRSSQQPNELERMVQALDVLLASHNQSDKRDKWEYEKAQCLFQLAVCCRQSERAYESGLLWKQLATRSSSEDALEKLLQAFRCFYWAEEIVCQETTECTSELFARCPWYSLFSVANQVAMDRCYRGLCEELNQLVIVLGKSYSSVPWTDEDLQKFVNRQKLQLVLHSIMMMNTTQPEESGGEEQSRTMQQWELLYRHYPRHSFLDIAMECYLDDFMHRPLHPTLIESIKRNCQRAIRIDPLHHRMAYSYLFLESQKHRMPWFSSIPSKSSPKTCAGYVIYFLIELIGIFNHSENVSIESIRSCCKEAISFIQETRKYRLCSLGHIEYLFRWIRLYYHWKANHLVVEQDEDWQWLQKYRFAYFEQDWKRLEWIVMKKRHSEASRLELNEVGKQRWIQERDPLAALEDWNAALSLPCLGSCNHSNDNVWMKCFHFIRKSLHLDDRREKSRTLCLLAFHSLYERKELEWAERRLIEASQNDVSYQLPFALLGFLFEYLSLNSSSSTIYQNRAIKCYQRCLLLSHPQHEFASWRLFRLYSKTQQLHAVQQLLQQLTTLSSCQMAWPYILLGSLQLSLGKNHSLMHSTPYAASSLFQTGLRYMRKESKSIDEDADLFIYLEPLLSDSMSTLQSQCMSSTAWLGLCDAYAADGRLSAALASCVRGLSSLEKACQQHPFSQPQLEMIHHRQLVYRVKKGHLLSLLNRLDEAVEELESIVHDQPHVVDVALWKCTLGKVYFKQAVSQFWSNGLYQRALNTLDKAISYFSLQNRLTDAALIDPLGLALTTQLYFHTLLSPRPSSHRTTIIDEQVEQSVIHTWRRMVHRYPHHSNNYMYWALISLILFPQSSSMTHPSRLAIQLIQQSRQALRPKQLLFVSFTSSLLLAKEMQHSNDPHDEILFALSLLGQLPANHRYSHLLVSLFLAALWLPLDEDVAYAFIQDALRRDPCKDTAWLLLGMWRERKVKDNLQDSVLSCYLEANRLAANPMALLGACRILKKIISPSCEEDISLVALCFAFAYRTHQSAVQDEWLPWFEKMIQQREEMNRRAIHRAETRWQIQRCIHQMPHLWEHWKLLK
ncbi:hypothetical protein GpartN1_g2775.t1 [Galdieria partita]|uniref:Tetratricopeptide repeat protein n=1 Tax=Galdieria partita TaxID=83374 RepID=A0A9C7PVH1_9RHOD|nr:hypothetical protein GpartN1_g2775.t1 [Galdieria partita]